MRAITVVVFFGWVCASVAVSPKIEVGLDQELSMPQDSYMLDYFKVSLMTFIDAIIIAGGYLTNCDLFSLQNSI